jgi:putative sterol carrier protein
LTQFWSKEFFEKAGERLNHDEELIKVFAGINTTILAACSDKNEAFLIQVENGKISSREAHPEDKVEFKFTAPYEKWEKIAKGELRVQSEVVKGGIKFSGSMPKMLLYLGKVVRMEKKILNNIRQMNLEY